MKKHHSAVLLTVFTAFTFLSFTGDKPAYLLFDQDGKKVKYAKMIKELEKADIIFFGELHTDPIAHWLQLELTKDLYDQKQDALVLGAEMFEADNQLILNEYLNDMYPTDKFEAEMRLWGNYQTDYKPMVEFAKENQIPFIATNIPRRYASMVHKKGFEALEGLSEEAKGYIAPLPILYDPEVKCYKDMLNMMGMGMPKKEMVMPKKDTTMAKKEMAMPKKGMGMPTHGSENLPKAQAAKDATMAHFIMENWSEGKTLFHLNGSYHSNNFQGIVWHLQQRDEDLKIITIATVLQSEIESVSDENLNIADYIICIPENMTRTKR